MKFTAKQTRDLESIEYFIPAQMKDIEITEEDRLSFLAHSERGIEPERTKGIEALIEGKRWRGIHVGMYEEGVLGGSMPYAVILDDMPKVVRWYMAREMFQGIDSQIILNFA